VNLWAVDHAQLLSSPVPSPANMSGGADVRNAEGYSSNFGILPSTIVGTLDIGDFGFGSSSIRTQNPMSARGRPREWRYRGLCGLVITSPKSSGILKLGNGQKRSGLNARTRSHTRHISTTCVDLRHGGPKRYNGCLRNFSNNDLLRA
jgi:hypothetical protein